MTKVSIIIVNYKTVSLVTDCIKSIIEKTKDMSYEIIVVDNNSDDGIKAIINKEFSNNVKCILLKENIGFGLANNEGFRIATGEYILCLNPDTVLINNAIKELADYLDKSPEVGICGGNLYDAQNQPTHSFSRVLPGIRHELYELSAHRLDNIIYSQNREFNHTGKPMEVGYITGADMMVRRDIINHVGGFSKAFFMYYEETDLTARIKQAGWKVMSVPSAHIHHLEGASFNANKVFNPIRYQISEKSRNIYMHRNISAWKRFICNAIHFFTIHFYYYLLKIADNPRYQTYKARIK